MSKSIIAFVTSILFSCGVIYLYFTPIYSFSLSLPAESKTSFNHVNMIIDASKLCRNSIKTNFLDSHTLVTLKTSNLNFGISCFDYISSRVVCEATFEFPYDKCELNSAEISKLAHTIKVQGLDINIVEKNNEFRYFLFYILGIIFIFTRKF